MSSVKKRSSRGDWAPTNIFYIDYPASIPEKYVEDRRTEDYDGRSVTDLVYDLNRGIFRTHKNYVIGLGENGKFYVLAKKYNSPTTIYGELVQEKAGEMEIEKQFENLDIEERKPSINVPPHRSSHSPKKSDWSKDNVFFHSEIAERIPEKYIDNRGTQAYDDVAIESIVWALNNGTLKTDKDFVIGYKDTYYILAKKGVDPEKIFAKLAAEKKSGKIKGTFQTFERKEPVVTKDEWSIDNIHEIATLMFIPLKYQKEPFYIKQEIYNRSIINLIKGLNERTILIPEGQQFVIGFSVRNGSYYVIAKKGLNAEQLYLGLERIAKEDDEQKRKQKELATNPISKRKDLKMLRTIKCKYFEPSRHLPQNLLSSYGERIKQLGEGTYGAVYIYERGDIKYAVKQMKTIDDDNKIDCAMMREISSLARLKHPNVVDLIDVCLDTDDVSLVLTLGISDLHTAIQDGIPFDVAKSYAYQIIRGVAYCLYRDVLNRDIKPQNVIVYADGSVKISDFGLARAVGCANPSGTTKEVYTIWYRPPEILLGDDKYGPAADIWATGCVIAELFAKHPLFRGNTETDMLLKQFRTLGVPTVETWPGVTNLPGWKASLEKITKSDDLRGLLGGDDLLFDLVSKMVVMNPANRISLTALLSHKFFNDVRENIEAKFPFKEDKILPACSDKLNTREIYPATPIFQVQNIINPSMLNILKNWMIGVQRHFFLKDRTLYFSFYLLDMVLNSFSVERLNLQLYGITCLYIASMYVEVKSITIDDASNITDHAYKNSQIRDTVVDILTSIDYDLVISICYDYFAVYIAVYPDDIKRFAEIFLYLLAFTNLRFIYLPHVIALIAILAACTYNEREFKHHSIDSQNVMAAYGKFIKGNHGWGITNDTELGDKIKKVFSGKDINNIIEKLRNSFIQVK